MDENKLKTFLTERGLFDLLKDLEVYCSSPASPEQPTQSSDSEMEIENTPKGAAKRLSATRPSGKSESEWTDNSDDDNFTDVINCKVSHARLEAKVTAAGASPCGYYYCPGPTKRPCLIATKVKPLPSPAATALVKAKSNPSIYFYNLRNKTTENKSELSSEAS